MLEKGNKYLNLLVIVKDVMLVALIVILWLKFDDLKSENHDDRIKNFIYENPEVIEDSFKKRNQERVEKQRKEMKINVEKNIKSIESEKAPSIGAKDSDIKIVEFFDYNCHYCKVISKEIEKLIDSDPKVKVIFQELPILSENSMNAARTALAVFVTDEKKYYSYHKDLMNQEKINDKIIDELLKKHGFNVKKIRKEMSSSKVNSLLEESNKIATKIKLRGTPSLIINGKIYENALDFDSLNKHIKNVRVMKKGISNHVIKNNIENLTK